MTNLVQAIFYLVLISLTTVIGEENNTDDTTQPSINLNNQTKENVSTGHDLEKIVEEFVIHNVNDWESKLVNETRDDLINQSDLKINFTKFQNKWKTANNSKSKKRRKKVIVKKRQHITTAKPPPEHLPQLATEHSPRGSVNNIRLGETGWKPMDGSVKTEVNSGDSTGIQSLVVANWTKENREVLTYPTISAQWEAFNNSLVNNAESKRSKKQLSTSTPMFENLANATAHLKNHIVENDWKPITGLLRTPAFYENTTDSLKIESSWASSFVQSAHQASHQALQEPSYSVTEAYNNPVSNEKFVKYPVFVRVNQPYPVEVKVPHPYPVEVKVAVPYPVQVPQPYPVLKNVPYYVKQLIYVPKPYPVEKLVGYPVKVPVEKLLPRHVYKPYPVKVYKNVYVPYIVKKPYPVKVYVEKKVPVHVEKKVPYPVKTPYPVPYPVVKKVPYTVYKKVPYPVKVPVDNPVPYEVIKYVQVPVEKEASYHFPHSIPMAMDEDYLM